jgi:protein O-mannosyl-transferase
MGKDQSSKSASGPELPYRRHAIAVFAVLAIAALLAYANSFSAPLILDDWVTIRENLQLRHLWPIWQALAPSQATGVGGRPIANLSFVLNHAVSGDSLAGYHAVNLAIHVFAGLALYGVLRRTFLMPSLRGRFGRDASWLAAGLAALWLLHPIQTESVTYISQRTEALMGFFYFAALYCFIRGTGDRGLRWSVLAVLSCGAGMATKEGMVTFPVIALLYDYAFVTRSFSAAWKARRGVYLCLAAWWIMLVALMSGLHGRGVGFGLGTTPFGYALTECRVVVTYVGLALWPARLVFDYGNDLPGTAAATAAAVLVLISALAFTVLAWRQSPPVGFLAGWFFVTLSPTSSIVPIPLQPMAENRVYLPLAAITTAIGLSIYRYGGGRAKVAAVIGAMAVGLGLMAHARNHDYRSEISIWADTAAKMPASSRAHGNLAQALQQAGRLAEAKAEYETALKLKPDFADAHANLASVWGLLGRNDLAIEEAQRALKIDPNFVNANYNLGIGLIHAGRPAEAVVALQSALRARPDYAEAHSWLAFALLQLNRPAEALEQAQAALRLKPELVDALYRGGLALMQMGRLQEAIDAFVAVARAQPDNADAYYALGTTLLNAGRVSEALASLQTAVRLNPNAATARANLGVALWRTGQLSAAVTELEAAARLDPTLAVARENLEKVRAEMAKATPK